MANQLLYKNPNTGKYQTVSVNLIPTIAMRYNGKIGYADLDEPHLQLSATKQTAAGASVTVSVSVSALEAYYNAVNGGPFIPHPALQGKETYITADITNIATSMVISHATTMWKGISENILVADRDYLLMHRKPLLGEDVWTTGTSNGLINCAAEVITIDSGYSSGTSVTIARGSGAAARKKGAVIQPLVGCPSSRDNYSLYGGLLTELEKPDALTLGTHTSASADSVDAYFVASTQAADTANSSGEYGVVTHYAVYVLPKTGKYLNNVPALPESAQPSQYDDTGQTDAVLAIGDAKVAEEAVGGTTYKKIVALNRYWNPLTGELAATAGGSDYWVGVKAMNQGTFDADLRASDIVWGVISCTS